MIFDFWNGFVNEKGLFEELTLVESFFGRMYDLPPSKTVAREDGRHRAGNVVCRPLIFVTVRALAGGGRCTVVEEIDRGPLAAWHSVPINRTVASLTEDLCAWTELAPSMQPLLVSLRSQTLFALRRRCSVSWRWPRRGATFATHCHRTIFSNYLQSFFVSENWTLWSLFNRW